MLDTLKVMGDSQFQPSAIEKVIALLKQENEKDFSSEVKYLIVEAEEELTELNNKILEYEEVMCEVGFEIEEILQGGELEKHELSLEQFVKYLYDNKVW